MSQVVAATAQLVDPQLAATAFEQQVLIVQSPEAAILVIGQAAFACAEFGRDGLAENVLDVRLHGQAPALGFG